MVTRDPDLEPNSYTVARFLILKLYQMFTVSDLLSFVTTCYAAINNTPTICDDHTLPSETSQPRQATLAIHCLRNPHLLPRFP